VGSKYAFQYCVDRNLLTQIADIDALTAARPLIKSLIPSVSELVYNKLLEQDITAQALLTQNTQNTDMLDLDDFYGPRSSNVKNRHMVSQPSPVAIVVFESGRAPMPTVGLHHTAAITLVQIASRLQYTGSPTRIR
jgi:hypothetical protein